MKPATVTICDACWKIEEGDREPIRMKYDLVFKGTCYRCQQPTRSGIYVRRMIEDDNTLYPRAADFVGIWEDKDDEDYKADIIKPPIEKDSK